MHYVSLIFLFIFVNISIRHANAVIKFRQDIFERSPQNSKLDFMFTLHCVMYHMRVTAGSFNIASRNYIAQRRVKYYNSFKLS